MIGLLLAAALLASDPAPAAVEAEAARPEALLEQGKEALYAVEYDRARALFDRYVEALPDSPRGYLHQASVIWLKELSERRDLRLDSFKQPGHFADELEGEIPAELRAQVLGLFAKAREKAEARLAEDDSDRDARYLLGNAWALEAAWDATVEHDVGAAISAGGQARETHRLLLELYPDYYDAYLTLGLYDYVTGSLPFYVKWIAYVMGYQGSKKDGLAYLELVALKGTEAKRDAQVALSIIYLREERTDEALALLSRLAAETPRSGALRGDHAALLMRLERYAEAEAAYAALQRDVASGLVRGLPVAEVALAHALALLELDQPSRARAEASQALAAADDNPSLNARAHLALARSLDALGERPEAVRHYLAAARTKDAPKDVRDEAVKLLRKPYRAPRPPSPEGE